MYFLWRVDDEKPPLFSLSLALLNLMQLYMLWMRNFYNKILQFDILRTAGLCRYPTEVSEFGAKVPQVARETLKKFDSLLLADP
jgi:hypothetical protein